MRRRRRKLRMGKLCLLCGNEKKRRFGSAKHVCDCEEVRRCAHG